MPLAPRPLPHDLGRAFSRADALAAGVSRGRFEAADLCAPFHGSRMRRAAAFAVDDPISDDDPGARDRCDLARVLSRLEGYVPVMPGHAFVAGRTAAVCHGLPVSAGPDLDIGVVAPHRAPRRDGIRGRKLEGRLVTVVDSPLLPGLRIASPASVWAMLGRDLDVAELVRVGDACVRIPRDAHGIPRPEARLATPAQLWAALDAGRRLGAARLERALALVRVGSMSPLETDLRLELVESGLPEPELDVEIRSPQGWLLGIADAVYHHAGVIVEVEGDHHRTSREQWVRDIEKHAAYVDAGWRVVRLTAAHIRSPRPRAVEMVARALGHR